MAIPCYTVAMVHLLTLRGFCLVLTASLAGVVVASDVDQDVHRFVNRFESRYRAARTLQTTFLERYTEDGHVIRVEAGIAYFRRPGKMRWEYQAPENNLYLVDGKTAWFYVPADHTATRVPAKASTDWRTPLALLAGEMKLSRVCAHVQAAPGEKTESASNVMLRCELRGAESPSSDSPPSATVSSKGQAAQAVFFEIVKNSGELVGVTVKDPGGIGIEFRFANWRSDPPLKDSSFQFHPPPGVAIVNGELTAGNGGINP